jgi:hypothetical protein
VDTLRVVLVRVIILKTSPFKPDKSHIHHRFLNAGYNHVSTTIIITVINMAIIGIAYNLLHLNLNTQIFCLLIYGSILYVLPFVIFRSKVKSAGFKIKN